MKINSKLVISSIAFCVLMISTKPVHAYLDPATGSMVIQALLAIVAAAIVTIGMFWRRFKLFFGRMFGRKYDEGDS